MRYNTLRSLIYAIISYKRDNNLHINKIKCESYLIKIFIGNKIFSITKENYQLELGYNFSDEKYFIFLERILNEYDGKTGSVDIKIFCDAIPYLVSNLIEKTKSFE